MGRGPWATGWGIGAGVVWALAPEATGYGLHSMAYVVMAYIVMAYIVMAHVVMAYIVMACDQLERSAAHRRHA